MCRAAKTISYGEKQSHVTKPVKTCRTTAVRRTLDAGFVQLLVTPGFPGYVSGHATISAAAAQVLSYHFPNQQKNYHLLAEEAANSRLWGGIHFDSDNKQGLLLGASVGSEVLLIKQKS